MTGPVFLFQYRLTLFCLFFYSARKFLTFAKMLMTNYKE